MSTISERMAQVFFEYINYFDKIIAISMLERFEKIPLYKEDP